MFTYVNYTTVWNNMIDVLVEKKSVQPTSLLDLRVSK